MRAIRNIQHSRCSFIHSREILATPYNLGNRCFLLNKYKILSTPLHHLSSLSNSFVIPNVSVFPYCRSNFCFFLLYSLLPIVFAASSVLVTVLLFFRFVSSAPPRPHLANIKRASARARMFNNFVSVFNARTPSRSDSHTRSPTRTAD